MGESSIQQSELFVAMSHSLTTRTTTKGRYRAWLGIELPGQLKKLTIIWRNIFGRILIYCRTLRISFSLKCWEAVQVWQLSQLWGQLLNSISEDFFVCIFCDIWIFWENFFSNVEAVQVWQLIPALRSAGLGKGKIGTRRDTCQR